MSYTVPDYFEPEAQRVVVQRAHNRTPLIIIEEADDITYVTPDNARVLAAALVALADAADAE